MHTEKLYELFLKSSGISTDTRTVSPRKIFFALKGSHFNGNHFAVEALNKGAMAVICDEQHFPTGEKIILVEDVLKALQGLANYHRRRVKGEVIAIGGSNGKTTTKELIRSVLATTYKTFATEGNLNNHIGVPLTLLSASADTEMMVIEIGSNHLGETKSLCEIIEPLFGLITNNGKDHLEGYGSLDGVRKGNGELYEFLKRSKGIAFVSADQADLMAMSNGMMRITYGKNESADNRAAIENLFPYLEINWYKPKTNSPRKLSTNLVGAYNFDNVMAAVSVGKYFGISDENIDRAIASYHPSNNRSQILNIGSNTFILDAYNANPSSMAAALESFSVMPVKNKIAILGDMLELGDASRQEHEDMIAAIQNKDFEKVIFVGSEFESALKKISNSFLHFRTTADLKVWFDKQHFSGYHIFLKGSRLIGLEKLIC